MTRTQINFGRILPFMALLIVFISPGHAQDELWKKAVTLQSLSENLIPGKLLMTMEMKDRKKQVEMTRETHIKMVKDETGEITPKVIKVLENGEDITEKELKTIEEEAAKKGEDENEESMSVSVSSEMSIFHSENQEIITIERTPGTENLNGVDAVKYTFRLKVSDEYSEVGSAWLVEKTGMPIKVASSPDPLPDHVKEMETITFYHTDALGRLVMERTDISGMGGFLFIKKYFSTTLEYDEYFEHEKSDTD